MKAHVGTVCNETADHLEKEGAALEGVDVHVKISAQLVKTRVNQKILTLWQKRWDEIKTSRNVY